VWNSLPSDLQEVLQAGAWIYTDEQNRLRRELNEYYYDMIVDGGVIVYSPTDAEIQQFIDACQPVYSYFVDKGVFTQAELDEMRRIVNET
jgi:TRAP-type C4-dicarboxylate transport system substrate-binding protein